jgi:type IV pilus assembly protein PilB
MVQLNEDYKRRVQDLRRKEEEDLAQMLSQKYSLSYVDLSGMPINTDALRLIPETLARKNKMAAFKIVGKKVEIAVLSPSNPDTMETVKSLEERKYEPNLHITSTASLERAWERYKDITFATETKEGILDISGEEISKILKTTKNLGDAKKTIEEVLSLKKGFRISRIVEIIVAAGLSTDSSDVHIEPEETYVRLRFRMDGILTDVLNFDLETYQLLLSRIKLLSGLKLNVKNVPQDGRFSINLEDSDIEIRTSTLPGAYGESIVLRILNPDSISVSLDKLGMDADFLEIVRREIGRPNGLILNTGPTGSGKTTTLYAFLKQIHTPQVKIITIEDPIEYHLPGIVQTQVESAKGYTFAEGLRSALRQDPDVIMVGEIRDKETAEIAVHASLTGHLVFSTLHTNNAAGTYPRLIDLGVNPKVITSAMRVSMAQRLVRKLCPDCKKQVPIEGVDKEKISRITAGIKNREKIPQTTMMYVAGAGCETCENSGYKGRVGIYEAILSDSNIEDAVEKSPSEREIVKAAESQNIMTMSQDGVVKVLHGITSMAELERVLDLEMTSE